MPSPGGRTAMPSSKSASIFFEIHQDCLGYTVTVSHLFRNFQEILTQYLTGKQVTQLIMHTFNFAGKAEWARVPLLLFAMYQYHARCTTVTGTPFLGLMVIVCCTSKACCNRSRDNLKVYVLYSRTKAMMASSTAHTTTISGKHHRLPQHLILP